MTSRRQDSGATVTGKIIAFLFELWQMRDAHLMEIELTEINESIADFEGKVEARQSHLVLVQAEVWDVRHARRLGATALRLEADVERLARREEHLPARLAAQHFDERVRVGVLCVVNANRVERAAAIKRASTGRASSLSLVACRTSRR